MLPLVTLVFFLSGFAALLYQVVWQRTLYGIYGVNIESVTVIVTAFMVGLGIGSVVGGALSENDRRPKLLWFAGIELLLGTFGFLSLPLFRIAGQASLHFSFFATAVVTFMLVLVPTVLMGATLPLLVAHFVKASGNVGRSVATLYGINTLGSAVASIAGVVYVLKTFGQSHSTWVAASTNVFVGVLVLGLHMKSRRTA